MAVARKTVLSCVGQRIPVCMNLDYISLRNLPSSLSVADWFFFHTKLLTLSHLLEVTFLEMCFNSDITVKEIFLPHSVFQFFLPSLVICTKWKISNTDLQKTINSRRNTPTKVNSRKSRWIENVSLSVNQIALMVVHVIEKLYKIITAIKNTRTC